LGVLASCAFLGAETVSEQFELYTFRVYMKEHNANGGSGKGHKEFFVRATCESAAVLEVLNSSDSPAEFAMISVDKLKNAVIL
jgi:hypothetical protein